MLAYGHFGLVAHIVDVNPQVLQALDPRLKRDEHPPYAHHKDASPGNQQLVDKTIKLCIVKRGEGLSKLLKDKSCRVPPGHHSASGTYMALQMRIE